jgi:hypothetical protein
MKNELLKCGFAAIVAAILISMIGCEYKTPSSSQKPEIKHVLVDNDLSEALGINLVKYEFNLTGLGIPKGKLPFIRTWVELYQDEKIIREWSNPQQVVNETGSILFAFYEPPLFTNDQNSIEAKVIIEGNGQTKMDISPDMPFIIFFNGLDFSEKPIKLDSEYILAKVTERFSPLAKTTGIAVPDPNSGQNINENKALILKVQFGLVDE